MTPEEELALITELLNEHFIPKEKGIAIYSVYGRVCLLAEKAAQHSVQPIDGGLAQADNESNPPTISG